MEGVLTSRAELLSELGRHEGRISAIRAEQVRILRELSRRGMAPRRDELAASLDIAASTAGDLLEAALRTPELSDAMESLETGEWSFDRATATARLVGVGADEAALATAATRDIAGVHRLRALHTRVARRDERRAHEERSVRMWPSLDEAAGFLSAQLSGYDWKVVASALDSRGDALPRDEQSTAEQRRADALIALAQDWLSRPRSDRVAASPQAVVTIMVDPDLADGASGEKGAAIVGGPRIGPDALELIMCEGSVEVLVDSSSGVPVAVGPTSRVVPPKVRRAVLGRDNGCVVDGCSSRYRLEVHHLVPRSQGGTHDLENLVTVCWWHHHVAIHARGMTFDSGSSPQRRRLVPPGRDP